MIEFWSMGEGKYKVWTNNIDVRNTYIHIGLDVCNTYFDPCEGNQWDFIVETRQLKDVVKIGRNLLKSLKNAEKCKK